MLRAILCFFFYSFIGWAIESALLSLSARKPVNKGLLTGPVFFLPGIILIFGIYFLEPTLNSMGFLILSLCIVSGVSEFLLCAAADQFLKIRPWDYSHHRWNILGYTCFTSIILRAIPSALIVKFVHPTVSRLIRALPQTVAVTVLTVCLVLLAFDGIFTLIRVRRLSKERDADASERKLKHRWTGRHLIKIPLHRKKSDGKIFAQGYNGYKLFWIFVIGALIGDIIEVLFTLATKHTLMSRSSLLYGPFSVVWGLGGVVLTVVLHSWDKKSDRYIFIGGLLIGGVYEYVCSMFTEYCFGIVFWDYSKIPFNINGRINLLFCTFWGLLALIWVKEIYPRLSSLVEMIPPRIGKPVTWMLAVFLSVSAILSAAALFRMSERAAGNPPAHPVGNFLDTVYTDDYLQNRYRNLIEK